ncbi:hypothetical protein [Liquorilactobacillus hordei]|uniref:Uncharacterized protein n=1 Tax=Liquorilactobacillus hordei DSM 19519 TaxID=1423759 RepID=A0A0R1MJY7_9LACO|nr:hypothetical protein [Liquorilactobacillus hordei]KRL08017.1 hypothetical protein FC92_GL001090 [Liquorilactobacillus hordei DSM 19519]QYH51036.1 hypothetical protein G6O70_00285 [Liquorilactobacillus hordei DSM 19519]
MRILKFRGTKVTVGREYKVGGVHYANLIKLNSGKTIKGVVVNGKGEFIDPEKKEYKQETKDKLRVTSKDSTTVFEYPSDDFTEFVAKKELNTIMVGNCISGKQKTHKGYSFELIK